MDKIETSIQRLKMASMMSETYYKKPLLLTYSGGKDSDACLELAKMAGIDFEVINSHTTADAPETVYYIRDVFEKTQKQGYKCYIEYPTYQGKRTSMWDLIPKKKMPPTRLMRYCCAVLKETSGRNRHIVTGVRWAESTKRKSRGIYEDINNNKLKKITINNDNDDKRLLFERCQVQAKTVSNVIIDWADSDVWNFLHDRHIKANPLYRCGFNRVGCIGCPMAGRKRFFEFAKYPKYKMNYIRAFDRMIEARLNDGKKTNWKNGESCFKWWMGEDENQMEFELD